MKIVDFIEFGYQKKVVHFYSSPDSSFESFSHVNDSLAISFVLLQSSATLLDVPFHYQNCSSNAWVTQSYLNHP